MNCPNCDSEMEQGESVVKGTRWGFLFFGHSYKHLFFKSSKKDQPKEKVLSNNHIATAYKCRACGVVTLLPDAKPVDLWH